jgi:hypothetical protein
MFATMRVLGVLACLHLFVRMNGLMSVAFLCFQESSGRIREAIALLEQALTKWQSVTVEASSSHVPQLQVKLAKLQYSADKTVETLERFAASVRALQACEDCSQHALLTATLEVADAYEEAGVTATEAALHWFSSEVLPLLVSVHGAASVTVADALMRKHALLLTGGAHADEALTVVQQAADIYSHALEAKKRNKVCACSFEVLKQLVIDECKRGRALELVLSSAFAAGPKYEAVCVHHR